MKALLFGYYGEGNLGDEMMLVCFAAVAQATGRRRDRPY
jgi:polysaccharide pyruvyl transferase WcaK-like protein